MVSLRPRFLLLLACFFLSGFAALLYQTAWTRELSFLFGTSEFAIAAVLASYMGGLAAGAAAAARFVPRLRRPVLTYALLELAIAASALALPFGLQALTWVYVALFGGAPAPPADDAVAARAFQLAGAFALLLLPTSCMGATLPLLARQAVEHDAQVGPRIGSLYAVNIGGAIAGAAAAGFILLPALGLRHTVWIGVSANLLVFLAASALAREPAPEIPHSSASRQNRLHWVLPVIGVSGAISFGYELIWTRLLVHLLGASVYAFATMLASFLAGLSIGSGIAAPLARDPARASSRLAVAELLAGALGLLAFVAADSLPWIAARLGVGGHNDVIGNALIAAAVLIPLATAIGATFPFAVRLAARGPEEAATASARVTAWNTVGAIFGALGTGLAALPVLGFAITAQLAVIGNFILAAIVAAAGGHRKLLGLGLVGGVALLMVPPSTPWKLLRSSPLNLGLAPGEIAYFAVGRSTTVLLTRNAREFRLSTNGLPEAAIDRHGALPNRSPLTRWMGMLPSLLRPDAQQVLLIGLGGGTVLEAIPTAIQGVDVIELEPKVVSANQIVAKERSRDPLSDPRIRIFVNDARGALLLSERHYDGIISQPSHPWTAGSANLYTREFFTLVRERLSEDGVFVQWMGLKFIDEALLGTLVSTLLDLFPHVVVFRPHPMGLLFAASREPFDVLASSRRALSMAPADFARFGVQTPEDVAAALVLDTDSARALASESQPNSDDNNLLATRSSLRSRKRLSAQRVSQLLALYSPNAAPAERADPQMLVRALVALGRKGEARSLAQRLPEGERQVALGWIALKRRPKEASRRFRDGLVSGGDVQEAQAGLLLSGALEIGALQGNALVVWRARDLAAREAWSDLAAWEDALSQIPPGDPLFIEASRLRVQWRIAQGSVDEARKAMEFVDAILALRDPPQDFYLLRADAGVISGDTEAGWAALEELARSLGPNTREHEVARGALEACHALPPYPGAAALCSRFQRAAGG